jgi:hypothetical protein
MLRRGGFLRWRKSPARNPGRGTIIGDAYHNLQNLALP